MRLRALQVFVELAHSDSIRQAAQRLDLSPTAISREIDHLEYFFRARLIDRGAGGIRFTEAGALLVERARSIVNDSENARCLIDDLRGLQRGRATIRAGGAVVAGLLAPALCEVHALHPGLRFHVEISSAGEVFSAVGDGIADLGVTIFSPDLGPENRKLKICDSREVSHAAIVSPRHPFAARPTVSLRELTALPLAIPDGSFGVRQNLERIAKAGGVRLDPVFVTGSLDMQKELAVRGAAALILPPLCCQREIRSGLLTAVKLSPCSTITTSLDLCKAAERTLSFAAQALLDGLTRTMRTQIDGIGLNDFVPVS